MPIKFTGVNPKNGWFRCILSDRMASRILDLGDFKTLIEAYKALLMKEKLVKWRKNGENNFTLDDFFETDESGEKVRTIAKYYWHVTRHGSN